MLQSLKREETSASHQDYAGRRKLKGVLVVLRRALCENETDALNHLSQCCLQELKHLMVAEL